MKCMSFYSPTKSRYAHIASYRIGDFYRGCGVRKPCITWLYSTLTPLLVQHFHGRYFTGEKVDCGFVGCKTSRMHKHKTAQNCGCPEVRARLILPMAPLMIIFSDCRGGEEDTKHVSDTVCRVPTRYKMIGLQPIAKLHTIDLYFLDV
jgi:hypothetical protein